jgi:peptidoglycan/LPS O-acetylase OafA/YrhL
MNKFFLIIFLAGLLAFGLPIWFVSYTDFIIRDNLYLSFIQLAIVACCFYLYSQSGVFLIVKGLICGVAIAVLIRFLIDFSKDSSSHNLLPLEILSYLGLALLTILGGIGLGFLLNRFTKIY